MQRLPTNEGSQKTSTIMCAANQTKTHTAFLAPVPTSTMITHSCSPKSGTSPYAAPDVHAPLAQTHQLNRIENSIGKSN
jgi:hypothetical protein